MSTFPVDGVPEVRVNVQIGRVDIVATPRNDIAVTVSPSNPSRAGDRSAAESSRVDRAGSAVVVNGPFRLNLFGPGDSVDVRVEAPETTVAAVDVKYGSAHLSGRLDSVRVGVGYGDISVDTAARLDVQGGYGEIRVTRVTGDAGLDLKSGSARIGRVDGALRVNGSNASVLVGSVGGNAEVATASGAVELGAVGGSATVRSAYGPVRVRELARGTARIDASYGTVDVGVRRGAAVWLDAVSQHAVVRTDLVAELAPAGDEETLDLQVRAGYGDITIHRSDPSIVAEP